MSGREAFSDHPLAIFDAPPFDAVQDLSGDPESDLIVFFAGNQFMVVPELVEKFRAAHPTVRSVFYETLPPGVVLDQFRLGGLRMGSLELRVRPDVLTLSPDVLDDLHEQNLVNTPLSYASNDLSLLVAAGNPKGVQGLADLGLPDLRVAIPDPNTEGIGRLALKAIENAGGSHLREQVEVKKSKDRTTVFTTIHHRQSPAWIASGEVDVAVVWSTEATYHRSQNSNFDAVTIPPDHNMTGQYSAAVVTDGPHSQAAAWFVDFLVSKTGQDCYRRYGFASALN